MTINAYAAMAPGEALQSFSYDPSPLGLHDIEVSVTHCGVCHSDVHIIDGDWGHFHPAVAGHEIIGTVVARGEAITHLEVGQRVGVGWQASSCMTCEWCLQGQENLCPNSTQTCRGRHGGFADAVRVDGRFAYPIPDALDSVNAAPLLCAGITVYAPLRRYAESTSRVGVIGIGGLGHLALQFATAFGCEVTAFSTSLTKEDEARQLGAHHFVNSRDEDALKSVRNSLDVIICTVNVQLEWKAYLRALRPRGVLCIVGAIPGEMTFPSGYLLGGEKIVTGSAVGSRWVMSEMLDFAARHHIVAQTETLPMSEVNTALDKVRNNEARYRMVLKNE